jgi:GNAT superfamily N-acetyltransferase
VIRALEPRDRDAWAVLWAGYNAFYGRPSLDPAITDASWRRFLDPGERMHAVVAEHEGAVVGLAHFLFHRSTTSITDTCYLQDLFVAEQVRGRGHARALIEAVREHARAGGATRFYGHTHESNATARRLYDALAERSGFIVYRMPV